MSAYGQAGRYPDHAGLERHGVLGRLKVQAMAIPRHRRSGNAARLARAYAICDELLDRLLDVRGR